MNATNEQLHEIIDLGINWHTRRNHKESEVVLLISMAHELLELREKLRWHDAKTDPPKCGGSYIAYWEPDVVSVRRYEHGYWSAEEAIGMPKLWMPLPEPPKEER